MITGRPTHLQTFTYIGLYRYFLTFCTEQRRVTFVEPKRVDLARTQILRAADDERFAIVAYRFMPDHLHLLIEARSGQLERSQLHQTIEAVFRFPLHEAVR